MGISDDPFGVVADDPRITRSGRFLRRTSLDELPQLVNVLRGEMSLVGPRPDLLEQVANYTDGDRRRLAVKPGITGWAQIHGRDEIPWDERFELDAWYVDNWSLALDARIVLATFTQLGRPDPEPVEDTLNIERARASRDQVPGHVPGGPVPGPVPSEGGPGAAEWDVRCPADAYYRRAYVESACVLEPGEPLLLEHEGTVFAAIRRP